MTGLMLCDDLMFTSKVAATARAQGLSVVAVRSAEQLLEWARASPPTGVILDLHTPAHFRRHPNLVALVPVRV